MEKNVEDLQWKVRWEMISLSQYGFSITMLDCQGLFSGLSIRKWWKEVGFIQWMMDMVIWTYH